MCGQCCKVLLTLVIYKECARFARTLLGKLLHAGCYNLEIVVQWISVYLNFPSLYMLAKLDVSAGKGSSAY